MLRRLAGAETAPLRRSLCTEASRPPWAMVYSRAALDASGAPSPGARASLDLDAAPYVSHISVPAHLTDGMDFAAASVRATSSDGLLLLDLAETRHLPPGPPGGRESLDRTMLHELSAAGAASHLDVARFVCNPLSGQLFRLPVPDMDVANTGTPFGLLTQSDRPHGPPDRFVVAQLICREGDNRKAVRRFLSETGEWDELPLFVPATVPDWPGMQLCHNHDVLALGDRLWWVDLTWGAFSINPFSDQPEYEFVELPQGSVLSDFDWMTENLMLGRRRLMGVSEGKLRYIEVSTEEEFLVSSFELDHEGCCWNPTRETTVNLVLPNKRKPLEDDMPWIVAIDPFNANILYYQSGHSVIAMDMSNGKVTGKSPFDTITGLSPCDTAFFLPCVLPTWLESSHLPGAGTLSRETTNRTSKTLADTLVRVDKDQKK